MSIQQQCDHQATICAYLNAVYANKQRVQTATTLLVLAMCVAVTALMSMPSTPALIQTARADIFSSTAHLQNLMYLERHLIMSLGKYVASAERRLTEIKAYIDKWQATAGRDEFVGSFSEDEIIGNPLQAFQLVKRLTVDWRNIRQMFSSSSASSASNCDKSSTTTTTTISSRSQRAKANRNNNKLTKRNYADDEWRSVEALTAEYGALMPTDDDLTGAALALVRLQDTYNLTESELADGNIGTHATRIQMTARDCLYLAKHAFNNAYYGHSLDWFEEALKRARFEAKLDEEHASEHPYSSASASESEIEPFYAMARQVVSELQREANGQPLDAHRIYMEASGAREHSTKFKMLDDDNADYQNYQRLCRGELLGRQVFNNKTKTHERLPITNKRLKCYLRNNKHPLLYLQPIRLEVASVNPFVSIIHNLMTPREATLIRELAAPMLTRARVQTDNGTADMVSKTRTSQTAWFAPDTHPIVNIISKRIEAATGLSADMSDSHCELMQVANYGMGGHYTPHYDYLIVDRPPEERDQADERELFAGDRTATLMFYLSDVAAGGSTVFPRLGVHLKPELGSAAFWYNLYKSGEGIIDTVHGACPVLMGEKWVANFWIRERGQLTKRPCGLKPDH